MYMYVYIYIVPEGTSATAINSELCGGKTNETIVYAEGGDCEEAGRVFRYLVGVVISLRRYPE